MKMSNVVITTVITLAMSLSYYERMPPVVPPERKGRGAACYIKNTGVISELKF